MSTETTGRPSATEPLRERSFRWYFAARLVNLLGLTMAPVALAFAVLDVEDSPSALGQVLAANSIPLVIFLLLGGVIADRLDRATVLRVTNVGAGLTQAAVAALVLTGSAELWHLIVLEAINGTLAAVSFPALSSLVPSLVPRGLLQPANVLLSMQRAALAIIGPSMAAVLVATVGPGVALAVDAATWLLSAALLTRVRIPPRDGPTQTSSVGADLRAGWDVFTGHTWLWVVVLAFGLLNAIHAAGMGVEVFSLGWNLAIQENIDERMLSRVYSYDALGSFVAIPVGQLTFGPLGEAFGLQRVIFVSAFVYAAIALATLASRSVRRLDRVDLNPT